MLSRYKIVSPEERYALNQQSRRAAIPVHLNIAEVAPGKSKDGRKSFCDIAGGSVIAIDPALDIALKLNRASKEALNELGILTFAVSRRYLK